MSTPLSTPIRQAKLGIASTKSLPLANEYKRLLNEQYQRLWIKHQQDLDLIDDIRSYVKARLSIERDYTTALCKLAKQHSNHISKKFILLNQCENQNNNINNSSDPTNKLGNDGTLIITSDGNNQGKNVANYEARLIHQSDASDSRLQKRLANNGLDEPDKPCTLYKVWCEHINRLNLTSKNRIDQFEQLIMVADKLKDIRSHKASMGKKCLDAHLKRIQEDVLVSMVDVEKARKLYYEDESQARKARENEEKIKKKRSGLLTKFTDLQAKKEKTSAQREANDIQSTQARNDYIMALAAANAHLEHYYQRDLNDFIHLIDDGVLDHCKIFMATLSECDLNSLKDALTHAQYWSKMINLTGSQKTNSIFFQCDESVSLRSNSNLVFEPCNNDPIQVISLEHNADYALQHEIDKWFTWFKKECRNLSQLMHQLGVCQKAFSEGKKSIELNGQTTEDIEAKIIELKQQIRKSEAAKLKAHARLKIIKEGGMQIEEWNVVESEIRADMARAQEALNAKRAKEVVHTDSNDGSRRDPANVDQQSKQSGNFMYDSQLDQVQLQVSKNSDDSDNGDSIHNLASVSRSTSNIVQKQQNVISGYSALTDPSLVWQDDYSNAWGNAPQSTSNNYNVVVTDTFSNKSPTEIRPPESDSGLLGANTNQANSSSAQQNQQSTSMTVQSSSPLSAIVDGVQSTTSPYQGIAAEAYKSDYECDYSRNGAHLMRSAASSAEPFNQQQCLQQNSQQMDAFSRPINSADLEDLNEESKPDQNEDHLEGADGQAGLDPSIFLNKKVIAIYSFDKTNEDDLSFNENDILNVIQTNDANWVKARNDVTKEEGYIPVSYIKLLDDDQVRQQQQQPNDQAQYDKEANQTNFDSDWNDYENRDTSDAMKQADASVLYCRALYDYIPEENTFENDGLPHLSLAQGELMKVIDQGEDDGWWLVEKDETGTRGHVPSMLVEEMDLEGSGEEEEDYDADDVSQYSNDEYEGNIKDMPTFEPPKLEPLELEQQDINNNNDHKAASEALEENQKKPAPATSLIPTSFIIIEPTPEVESKSIADSIAKQNMTSEENKQTDDNKQQPEDRQIIHSTNTKPPTDVSYCVINEEFVLEGPTRKPHQHSDINQHHETPTIMEEMCDTDGQQNQISESSQRKIDESYEPLSENDSAEISATPAVVIEITESERQVRSDSSEYDNDDSSRPESPSDYVQKEIRHTGNVDVNPMLRHRAEEFTKQIISEALMMAPGADIGPSTSAASSD